MAIGETPFCVSSEGTTKRVDTRVIYKFSEFLQEAVKADPDTIGEAFKRMLALKMFLKHGDHFLFASAPLAARFHARVCRRPAPSALRPALVKLCIDRALACRRPAPSAFLGRPWSGCVLGMPLRTPSRQCA